MGNYNFTKFHQNQTENKKSFFNSPFFCSEFQSVSRIMKIVHSALRHDTFIFNFKFLFLFWKYFLTLLRTMYDFHDSTDTLKFWTEKRAIKKNFFVFHLILMKLGEVVVIHVYYNFTKFHQNRMKNKKVLLIAHFSVQNFKVSVELWKSYIVL